MYIYYMWRLTAALWFFILFCDFLVFEVRVICTLIVGCIEFIDTFSKRLRLYRIERTLKSTPSMWYIPFMVLIALLHGVIIVFAWMSLHGASAYTFFPYGEHQRRLDIVVGVVIGSSCYVLERLAWKAFFECI